MFERCAASAKRAGVDTSRWALITGSKTFGNSWAVVNIIEHGAQSTVHRLGYTRTEAYLGLYGMAVAFELVTS